ncbi:MAG: nuclease-related domain-containing protein [Nitrososphaerota archaeon]
MSNIKTEVKQRILLNIIKLSKDKEKISFKELMEYSNVSKNVLEEVLKSINLKINQEILINGSEKLSIAFEALTSGVNIEELAKFLNWKDFEKFSSKILYIYGYDIAKNFRIKENKKRIEIDILAIKGNLILLFDCKKWNKPLIGKNLEIISKKQYYRAKIFEKLLEKNYNKGLIRINILPIILSLYETKIHSNEYCTILYVRALKDFLEKIDVEFYNLPHITIFLNSKIDINKIKQF